MKSHRLRRWFQFSLRGIFILMTLLGIWLGVQVKWWRDRQEARKWIAAHEVEGKWSLLDVSDPNVRLSQTTMKNGVRILVPMKLRDVPWSVRALGERRLNFIHLDKGKLSKEDARYIDSLQSLFPEAEGVHVQEPGFSTCWPPEDLASFFD
jgi:hypothetical protein